MEIVSSPRPIEGCPPPNTGGERGEGGREGGQGVITCIATGEGHTLAVMDGGKRVWAWGCGSSGQLGVGRKGGREGGGEEKEDEEEGGRAALGSCR